MCVHVCLLGCVCERESEVSQMAPKGFSPPDSFPSPGIRPLALDALAAFSGTKDQITSGNVADGFRLTEIHHIKEGHLCFEDKMYSCKGVQETTTYISALIMT